MRKGDTLIEVMLAVGIFGLASVGAISLMNRGLTTAQASLETAMARQEIDTQAEALRFIHDAYLTEPTPETTEDLDCEHNITSYHTLWQCIVRQAYTSTDTGPTSLLAEDPNFYTREVPRGSTCDSLFTTSSSAGSFGLPSKSFILNPRLLSNYTTSTSSEGVELSTPDFTGAILTQSSVYPERFRLSGTYPRLIFSSSATALADDEGILSDYSNGYKNKYLQNAEGIWITAVASNSALRCNGEDASVDPRPDFYDFKIQTCWDAPGGSTASTISSTVRLFNPDQIPSNKAGGSITVTGQNVAFLIDVSGSMYGAIENATSEAAAAADVVFSKGGKVAVYSYSDKNIGEEVVEYCNFDTCGSGDNVRAQLDRMRTSGMMGGGDGPESAVHGAMTVINNLNWTNGGAIVILTDAPTHGAPCSSGACGNGDAGYTQDQLIAAALERDIKIYVAGSVYENNYDTILSSTGGAYYGSNVATAFQEIAQSLTITQSSCYGGGTDDTGSTGGTGSFTKPEDVITPVTPTEDDGEDVIGEVTFENAKWEVYDNFATEHAACAANPYGLGCEYNTKICRPYYEKVGTDFDGNTISMCTETTGDHVIVSDTNIRFLGYNMSEMSEGARYKINSTDYFQIEANINTSGILIHPEDGYFNIFLGAIKAELTGSGGTFTINGEEVARIRSGNFKMTLTKEGDKYTVQINDDAPATRTVSSSGAQYVDFYFHHKAHSCEKLSNVYISNIKMTRYH